MFNLNPLKKWKNKSFLRHKQKYSDDQSFQKNRIQQDRWYAKQNKNKNWLKLDLRTWLRGFQKSRISKPFIYKFSLRKKTAQALITYKSVNYTALKTVISTQLSQPFTNLFLRSSFLKTFTFSFLNCPLLPYVLADSTSSIFLNKGQYLNTIYSFTTLNSFQLYKNVDTNFYSLKSDVNLIHKNFKSWESQNLTVIRASYLTKNFSSYLNLFSFLVKQSVFFNTNRDVVTRFFPKTTQECYSKNFYILSETTKAFNLKGGALVKPIFQKKSLKTVNFLQNLLLNENNLENNFNISRFSSKHNQKSLLIGLRIQKVLKRRALCISLRMKKVLKRNFSTSSFKKMPERPSFSLFKIKTKKRLANLFTLLMNFEQPSWEIKSKLLIKPAKNKALFKNYFSDLFFTNTNLLKYVFTTSLLFKYLFSSTLLKPNLSSAALMLNLNNSLFTNSSSLFKKSNIIPSYVFNYKLKRRVLKAFTYDTFSPDVTMWYYHTIVRFIENCTGKKVYLKFNPFIESSLTFNDLSRCIIWADRVVRFRKVLGPRMFLRESLNIMTIAIRYRDPTFLANWIRAMLKRTNFYKYKPLIRYLKYVFTHLFQPYFKDLGFKGLKLKLKGKICVAGNSRTRTWLYRVGTTSHATFDNRVVYDLSYINTFTGVIGFQLWFYY